MSQNLLKLEEDRALVGIEINKNPPIENTFTLYVNGIRQENVLKFAPQDCEILIRAKKGFVYANPFVLQPLSCSAAPRAIVSWLSHSLVAVLRALPFIRAARPGRNPNLYI